MANEGILTFLFECSLQVTVDLFNCFIKEIKYLSTIYIYIAAQLTTWIRTMVIINSNNSQQKWYYSRNCSHMSTVSIDKDSTVLALILWSSLTIWDILGIFQILEFPIWPCDPYLDTPFGFVKTVESYYVQDFKSIFQLVNQIKRKCLNAMWNRFLSMHF